MADNLSKKNITEEERKSLYIDYEIPFNDDYDYLQHFAPPRNDEIYYFIPANGTENGEELPIDIEMDEDISDSNIDSINNQEVDSDAEGFLDDFLQSREIQNKKGKKSEPSSTVPIKNEDFDLLIKGYESRFGMESTACGNDADTLAPITESKDNLASSTFDKQINKYPPLSVVSPEIKSKILIAAEHEQTQSSTENDSDTDNEYIPIIIPDTPAVVDKVPPKRTEHCFTPSVISFASSLQRAKRSNPKHLGQLDDSHSVAFSQRSNGADSTYSRLSVRSKVEDKETKALRKHDLKAYRATRRLVKAQNREAFVKENEAQRKNHINHLVTKSIRPI